MTRVTEDLEIFDTDLDKENKPMQGVRGQYDFSSIVDNEEGDNYHECHVIMIHSKLENDVMVYVVCHELEHYDVTKSLLANGILTSEQLLHFSRDKEGVFFKYGCVEWTHSSPSYVLEKNAEEAKPSATSS